jgi:hypothetical protein
VELPQISNRLQEASCCAAPIDELSGSPAPQSAVPFVAITFSVLGERKTASKRLGTGIALTCVHFGKVYRIDYLP